MIAISAGHNPTAKGAKYHNELNEYDEACRWVQGIVSSGPSSTFLEVPTGNLRQKVAFINDHNCKLAVEIHFNSLLNNKGKHTGSGAETLYCPGSTSGKFLATEIQKVLSSFYPPDRGIKEGWYQLRNFPLYRARDTTTQKHGLWRKSKTTAQKDSTQFGGKYSTIDYKEPIPDYFLKRTNCPAIIIEPEFVHHYETIRQFENGAWQALSDTLVKITKEL